MFVDAQRKPRVARLLHRDQFRVGAGRIICARLLLIGGKLRAIKMKARSTTKTLKVRGIFLNGTGPARGTTIVFQRVARQDSFNARKCFAKEHHERQTQHAANNQHQCAQGKCKNTNKRKHKCHHVASQNNEWVDAIDGSQQAKNHVLIVDAASPQVECLLAAKLASASASLSRIGPHGLGHL